MIETVCRSSDVRLEEWLIERIGPATKTLVTDHPWAQTYHVETADRSFYLKVLPPSQRAGMRATDELSQRFTTVIPRVVALDVDLGFLLLEDHGGYEMGSGAGQTEQLGVLQTYATLQAACIRNEKLLHVLPRINLAGLVPAFCRFFDAKIEQNDTVGAAHFLGEDRARFYFERLVARSELLEQALSESRRLPLTANHCDLRMRNTALTESGSSILFDWDEVVAGPAGMSLHNFFSGCSAVVRLLQSAGPNEERHELLQSYISSLEEHGYASRETIRAGLPGAMCAGVMRYLMSYGNFPTNDESDREQIAKILTRRVEDLIIFCDLRASSQRPIIQQLVDDYENADVPERARHLLMSYLEKEPGDLEMQARLGYVHRYLGDGEAAEQLCRRALETAPLNTELRHLLSSVLVDRLALDDAVDQIRLAATFAPKDPAIRQALADTVLLQELEREAARPGCVPTIRFTAEEKASGRISRAKRRLASRLFRQYGTLVVEDVFDTALLDQLASTFEDQYREYLGDDRPENALKVGNKRFMITVNVENVFNTPDLYAPHLLTPILERLLGDDFILGSFTAVTSLPGAADMRMHKDHPALFDADELPGPLPTIGVTTLIPLRGFDLTMGTTRVVKGSHNCSSDESAKMEWQDPCAPQGSCLLMDYRLSHQGLANRSKAVRPVLSLVYNRPWFRDCVNYELQEPLRISRSAFDQVSKDWQRLFGWIRP